MPHLTGPDLMRAARESQPGLPVVLMSGYGRDDPAGPSGPSSDHTVLLAKPFNGDTLAQAVAQALQSARRPAAAAAPGPPPAPEPPA